MDPDESLRATSEHFNFRERSSLPPPTSPSYIITYRLFHIAQGVRACISHACTLSLGLNACVALRLTRDCN